MGAPACVHRGRQTYYLKYGWLVIFSPAVGLIQENLWRLRSLFEHLLHSPCNTTRQLSTRINDNARSRDNSLCLSARFLSVEQTTSSAVLTTLTAQYQAFRHSSDKPCSLDNPHCCFHHSSHSSRSRDSPLHNRITFTRASDAALS